MKPHRLSKLFPPMTEAEYATLVESIRQNGLRVPITTFEGAVLDGVHREKACREVGVEPRYEEWDGVGSPTQFVVDQNLHRRQLTRDQRRCLAVDLAAAFAKEASKRQEEAGKQQGPRGKEGGRGKKKPLPADSREGVSSPKKDHSGESCEQAAAAMGVGGRGVQEAKAIKKADPGLFDRVKAGELSHAKAKRELQKRARLAQLEAAASAQGATQAMGVSEILTGDCCELLQSVTRASVRLVFADPPYNIGVDYGGGSGKDRLTDAEYVEWVCRWFDLCHQVIASDGSFWVLISHEYAAEYDIALRKCGFTIRSRITWFESFGVNCARNFNRCSRRLFWCVKDPKCFVFNLEAVTRLSDRQTKYNDARADAGGKCWDDVWGINPPIPRLVGTASERVPEFPTQLPLALLRPIIGCASDPGDLVLDPFCGSGTTGVASLELGRRFVGIEKSVRFAELAKKRMAENG